MLDRRRLSELRLALIEETMMNGKSQADRTGKRAYQKPELTEVSLKPEEAVLGSCKRGGRSGPGQPKCLAPAPCSSSGS